VALLERELDGLPARAGERRVLLATQLGLGMLLDALVVDASARVEREAAEVSGDTAAERLLLGSLALIRGRTGTKGAAGAAEAAERALEAGGLRHDEAPGTLVRVFVSLVLLAADRDTDAERWLERLAAVAREDGAEMTLGIAELGLGRVWRFRGALAPARAAVERSLERALIGSSYGRVVAGGTLTALLVDCGELDAADRSLGELGLGTGPLPGLGAATTLLRGRMALHSARRRHAEACADADDVLDRLERRRHRAPGPLGEAAMAYLAAGEAERARGAAEEELERARRWGTPSALGIAELQLGLAAGHEPRLERAVTTLAETPCRLELAKALLALGAARRRANRRSEAREPLRRALDLAARCGAEPVAADARTELAACGARPRRALLTGRDSLTASERRVAELVAQGLSNPEVARALVVTRSTVESHLKATYRKLDVSSREELAAALRESSPRVGDASRPAAGGGLRA
jgi:DNA-binding CsgD family transcriptional regulator